MRRLLLLSVSPTHLQKVGELRRRSTATSKISPLRQRISFPWGCFTW